MIESLGMEQFLFQLINETTHLVTEAFRRCQVLRWNLAIASAAKTARWKRAITLLQGLHMQHLQPDTHLNTLGQGCGFCLALGLLFAVGGGVVGE